MKNERGFTLIELLAVVVILAIIAFIAIPTILSLIWKSRIKALEDSCYGLIEAINEKYITNVLNEKDTQITNGVGTDIKVLGEKPFQGTWYLEQEDISAKYFIIIENVSFPSMRDYICTNKDTPNNRVECKKSDALELNRIEYSNEEYTHCEEVNCALNELYKKIVKES